MRTSATGATERRGFTLLEVLVVLAIVAVGVATAVSLSLRGGADRRLEAAAQRALLQIALACERAALTGRDVGIALAADGLRFGHFQPEGWQPVADRPSEPLRARPLGRGVALLLRVDGAVLAPAADARPAIACYGSGELTPFELELSAPDAEARWRLSGDFAGTLELRRIERG